MKIIEQVENVASSIKPRLLVSMMLVSIFCVTVFHSQLANAGVYKKVDADGNVSFSDVPDKNAQMITVAPLSTVPAMSPELIASTLDTDSKSSRSENYTMTIFSPTPGQTYYRATDAFSANVQVRPDLKNGDRLVLFVDGKSAAESSSIAEMDRGQHQFEAKVLNSSGRLLMTKSVSFFVQQPNVKQQIRMGIKH